MPWTDQVLENTTKLFDFLTGLTDSDIWACRGLTRSYDKSLHTRIDRYEIVSGQYSTRLSLERHAMARFLYAARALVTVAELQLLGSIIPRMMIMQHYGAPTRLLDWTKSPWVSLYFACSDHMDEDGEVWLFDRQHFYMMTAMTPVWNELLNEGAPPGQIPPQWGQLFAHTPREWTLLFDPLGASNGWTIPHANPRIISQQALFSICGRLGTDHAIAIEDAMGVAGQNQMHRLIIPAALKIPCLKRLASMNITAASLFPGIDGLGRHVADSLRYSFMLDPMNFKHFFQGPNGIESIEIPPF